MADSASYPIRLTGSAPAPPTAAKKGGGRKKKKPLVASDPQSRQQRHNYSVPPALTLGELKSDAASLFGVASTSRRGAAAAAATARYDVRLLTGFPPRPIDVPDSTVVRDVVERMESVVVRFDQVVGGASVAGGKITAETGGGGAKRKAANGNMEGGEGKVGGGGGGGGGGAGVRKRPRPSKGAASATASSPSSPSAAADSSGGGEDGSASGRRPRRAAAAAASAGFADVIREQDRLMAAAEGKKKKSSKKGSTFAASASAAAATRAANLAKAREAAAASRRMKSMDGYRLSDGAAVPASRDPPRSSSSATAAAAGGRKSRHTLGSTEDDVSYNLLSSLESGGAGGKVGKFLRAAMRGAVGRSYERSRAAVRADAVRSGRYSMEAKVGGSTVGGRLGGVGGSADTATEVGIYTVRYSKGVEGRGEYEEDVEVIGLEALRAVIGAVHSSSDGRPDDDDGEGGGVSGPREMLRAANMAQLSPRVFWSLAHHFPNVDTESALRRCCPGLDWSFLDGRTRVLSEKARENRRQERAARGGLTDGNGGNEADYDRAAAAVEAVEDAMERMREDDAGRRRERAARAAAARFGGEADATGGAEEKEGKEQEGDVWRLVTPDEVDEDELRECILEGCRGGSEGEGRGQKEDHEGGKEPEELSGGFVPDSAVVDAWVQTLVTELRIRNWREMADAGASDILPALVEAARQVDAAPSSSSSATTLTEPVLESILESARLRSVDEITLEILDGDQNALESLREEARAGTPRDLANWADCPDVLLEMAPTLGGKNDVGAGRAGAWCRRAREALERCNWLNWYATPLD